MEMELSEEEEDDDFHELSPNYEDSDMFTNDDHVSRRKQDPLSKYINYLLTTRTPTCLQTMITSLDANKIHSVSDCLMETMIFFSGICSPFIQKVLHVLQHKFMSNKVSK